MPPVAKSIVNSRYQLLPSFEIQFYDFHDFNEVFRLKTKMDFPFFHHSRLFLCTTFSLFLSTLEKLSPCASSDMRDAKSAVSSLTVFAFLLESKTCMDIERKRHRVAHFWLKKKMIKSF
jgi:hypothetical protein